MVENMTNTAPPIEIRGLVKAYTKGQPVVTDFNLVVDRGEFVSLLGPSGCGKTTTLRCVAGLESVTEGEIFLDGQLVSAKGLNAAPRSRRIGMVFQSYALWPHMTVFDNVAYPLKRTTKANRSDIGTAVQEALEMVGIPDKTASHPFQLSGGQQQRVALARALVHRPEVVLFDEPLSNLDARLREQMRTAIRELAEDLGFSALYVTHDQSEALLMSDRVVVMRAGQIMASGGPERLYRRPGSVLEAGALGDATIWDGDIVGYTADTIELSTPAGPVTAISPDDRLSVGERVKLVIRRNAPRVLVDGPFRTEEPELNEFDAQTSRVWFLGDFWSVTARVGPGEIPVDFITLEEPQLSPGEAFRLGIPRSAVTVVAP